MTVQGREVQLTPLEFKLLAAFVQNPNQVLSRDQLLELVWGDPYGVSGDQVKLYVGYLRKKLLPDAAESRRSRPCAASATATAGSLARSGSSRRSLTWSSRSSAPERLREVRVGARLHPALDVRPPARAPRAGSTFSSRSSSSARSAASTSWPVSLRHHHVEHRDCRPAGRARARAPRRRRAPARPRSPRARSRSATSDRMSSSSSAQRMSGRVGRSCRGRKLDENVVPAASPPRTPIRPPCASTIAFEM